MTRLEGQCHCGAVRVSLETALPASELGLRACQCGFCRRHGALSTSHPQARITFTADDGVLTRYRFGQKLSNFLICANCGCYVGALAETDVGPIAILNVRGVDLPGFEGRTAEPMTYDGETAEARTARRKARWSPASSARSPSAPASGTRSSWPTARRRCMRRAGPQGSAPATRRSRRRSRSRRPPTLSSIRALSPCSRTSTARP